MAALYYLVATTMHWVIPFILAKSAVTGPDFLSGMATGLPTAVLKSQQNQLYGWAGQIAARPLD
jgi:hypothetical protein